MERDMVLSRIAIHSTPSRTLKQKYDNFFGFAQKIFTYFDRPRNYFDNKPMPFEQIPTHVSLPDYVFERDHPAQFEAAETARLHFYQIAKWEFAVNPAFVVEETERTIRMKVFKLFNAKMYGVFQIPYFITRCLLTMIGLGGVGRKLPNFKRGVICSEIGYWWIMYHAIYYGWDDVIDLLEREYKPDNFHSLDTYNVVRYCEEKEYLIFYR